MDELAPTPAFTYDTASGILTVARAKPEPWPFPIPRNPRAEPGINTIREDEKYEAMTWLVSLPGVRCGGPDTALQVCIPIEEALEADLTTPGSDRIDDFLYAVSALQPSDMSPPDTDRVITTPGVSWDGIRVEVYNHFQAWLNDGGLTENVARDCLTAMAVPFSSPGAESVDKKFMYTENSVVRLAIAGGFQVATWQESFGFERFERQWGKSHKITGSADWQSVGLTVPGSNRGHSLNPRGKARQHVRIDPRTKQLYEMWAHEPGTDHLALSLLLGLGSLAHHAVQHSVSDEALTGIRWGKPQRQHGPIPGVRNAR